MRPIKNPLRFAMPHHRSYSADVRLWLETAHGLVPVAQVGPDFIITKSTTDRPEIDHGELFVEVDGNVKTVHVLLPEGVRHSDTRTPIANFLTRT
jgi:hypothetical protein